ncbi:MAG: aldo/keto reductase [Coprothermobacterota bacterium]|nr:aldo/keto reductase [Coprothermobacterota bacterium]
MQYRTFGCLDWKPSALGFGAMRLPVLDGDPKRIDEEQATAMLQLAIDGGVNYVDTAYPYHGGTGEVFIGKALEGGNRSKVRLATKLPCWLVTGADDFERYLDEQLARLCTESIDCYLLHSLSKGTWSKVRDLGVLDWAERAKADGRIQHLGFSFHDSYPVFQEIIDAYDNWDFCQIQYNYMDIEQQAGRRGLQYAAAKGLGVVVMEPIRGGHLANPPDPIKMLWSQAENPRSPADWALQWVWDQAEVSLVLSGMSTLAQVQENLTSAERSQIGSLSNEEQALIAQACEKYRTMSPVPCTGCGYCQPCPQGVRIPAVLELYNEAIMYNTAIRSRFVYANWFRPEGKADRCTRCGQCLEHCPQAIPIPQWLEKAQRFLSGEEVR